MLHFDLSVLIVTDALIQYNMESKTGYWHVFSGFICDILVAGVYS